MQDKKWQKFLIIMLVLNQLTLMGMIVNKAQAVIPVSVDFSAPSLVTDIKNAALSKTDVIQRATIAAKDELRVRELIQEQRNTNSALGYSDGLKSSAISLMADAASLTSAAGTLSSATSLSSTASQVASEDGLSWSDLSWGSAAEIGSSLSKLGTAAFSAGSDVLVLMNHPGDLYDKYIGQSKLFEKSGVSSLWNKTKDSSIVSASKKFYTDNKDLVGNTSTTEDDAKETLSALKTMLKNGNITEETYTELSENGFSLSSTISKWKQDPTSVDNATDVFSEYNSTLEVVGDMLRTPGEYYSDTNAQKKAVKIRRKEIYDDSLDKAKAAATVNIEAASKTSSRIAALQTEASSAATSNASQREQLAAQQLALTQSVLAMTEEIAALRLMMARDLDLKASQGYVALGDKINSTDNDIITPDMLTGSSMISIGSSATSSSATSSSSTSTSSTSGSATSGSATSSN